MQISQDNCLQLFTLKVSNYNYMTQCHDAAFHELDVGHTPNGPTCNLVLTKGS